MRIFVCIDDTDNLESKGTGWLASILAEELEKNYGGKSYFITRHQLFVNPNVLCTSHNSSMCFAADLDHAKLERFIGFASELLENESAQGADPGLCVAHIENPDYISGLIDFGRRAKTEVLTKKEACNLAYRYEIHLSEHGGTGDGVIGALAGVGLRLSANDGRLRGKLKIRNNNLAVRVAAIRDHDCVDAVRSTCGKTPGDDELVRLGDKVKAVLLDGKRVLLVSPVGPAVAGVCWRTCSRQELENY
jgi:hypothetical protein